MKQIVSGTFLGSNSVAQYLCFGFVPDGIIVREHVAASNEMFELLWTSQMRGPDAIGGGQIVVEGSSDLQLTNKASGAGISVYEGGDILTAALQTSAAYGGTGPYLGWDPNGRNYRILGAASASAPPTTYTRSGTRTGSFDNPISTTYIESGARVFIESPNCDGKGRWYNITNIDNDGDAAGDVDLDRDAPSGRVLAITGMYDLIPLQVGKITPAGVLVAASLISQAGICSFEAWTNT